MSNQMEFPETFEQFAKEYCYTCMKSFYGWEKTGRHFPQIAEVLQQMKEGTDETD